METNSIRGIVQNYLRYRKIRRRIAKVYYNRLIKASLLISTVPIIAMAILVIYERLSLGEGILAVIAVFYGSTFFAKPYLADLSSLTNYVEQLALDRKAEAPPLSFLGNVDELSVAVKNLHASWGDRKIKLEAAIAESTILFDTLPDILMMLDDELRVVRANNAACLAFGSNIIRKNLEPIVPSAILIDSIKSVMGLGKGKSVELSVSSHGLNRDYLAMIEKFPVHSPGGIAVVLVMHDVTESKRTKQMTKDFVANASHEIRTPLTSLIGFIETIRTSAKDDPQAQEKFLAIMAEQAEQMSILVNDLLSLSKIEMRESNAPTALVDIKSIVASAINRLGWAAENKKMPISFQCTEKLPQILGDTNELMQVFTNIISNAIKYGEKNTPITIRAGNESTPTELRQQARNVGMSIYVSITNEGEGIAAEDIPRVTERFYRVDKVRTRKLGGAGLGLAIVKHILNRHSADLIVESEGKDKGSTFTVRLPVPDAEQLARIKSENENKKKS